MATGGTQAIAGSASGTNYVMLNIGYPQQGYGGVTIGISNRSTSAGPVYVLASGLHDDGEPMPLAPGDKWPFRVTAVGRSGGGSILVKGDGTNAATVDFGILTR